MTHSFDPALAVVFGLEEAVLIHAFQWWISKNRAEGRHAYEGRTWTYNSYPGLARLHGYWSDKQLRRLVASLISQGVLIRGDFNAEAGTGQPGMSWYAFADEERFLSADTLPKRAGRVSKRAGQPAQTGRAKYKDSVTDSVTYQGEHDSPPTASEVEAPPEGKGTGSEGKPNLPPLPPGLFERGKTAAVEAWGYSPANAKWRPEGVFLSKLLRAGYSPEDIADAIRELKGKPRYRNEHPSLSVVWKNIEALRVARGKPARPVAPGTETNEPEFRLRTLDEIDSLLSDAPPL